MQSMPKTSCRTVGSIASAGLWRLIVITPVVEAQERCRIRSSQKRQNSTQQLWDDEWFHLKWPPMICQTYFNLRGIYIYKTVNYQIEISFGNWIHRITTSCQETNSAARFRAWSWQHHAHFTLKQFASFKHDFLDGEIWGQHHAKSS